MSLKLTYFNARGGAELTRYILAYGEVKYEDERIQDTDWPAMKEKTSLGMLPFLTLENGKQYGESVSIARYFAEKFDLTGKTDEERLHASMVVDVLRMDILSLLLNIYRAKDEDKDAKKKEAQTKIDELLKRLDTHYVEGSETFLASGLSWADIVLFDTADGMLPSMGLTVDGRLTKLAAIVARVKNEPKIAKWISERPVTEH